MHFSSFFKLVEIRTKLASQIPLLLGTVYAYSRFHRLEAVNFLLLFLSLLSFDMVTTALNNYFDYKRAKRKHGYNYEVHNVIVRDRLSEFVVVSVILMLLCFAVLTGLLLVRRTDILVLLIGMLSFLIGICYSFGPIPVSRTPFGELLSGFFMGFVIIFLSVYIHLKGQNLVVLSYSAGNLTITLGLVRLLEIFLLSVPVLCGISNIMLANNICDMEEDYENRRYTLPVYIGREWALLVFRALYYLAFADIVLLVFFNIVPVYCLGTLLLIIPVERNIRLFLAVQTKKDTFSLSVRNFLLIGSALTGLMAVGALMRIFLP